MKKQHLNISQSLSAMLFGVLVTMITISSLSITGTGVNGLATIIAVTAILINIGHGILHGYLYVFEKGFERGKYLRYGLNVKAVDDRSQAIALIEKDLDESDIYWFSPEVKRQIAEEAYEKSKQLEKPSRLKSRKDDYLGGFYKGLLIFIVGMLVVWPLLVFPNLDNAILVCFSIAILCLGVLGWKYAEYIFRNRIYTSIGLIIIGLMIVAITLILGG